MSLWKIIVIPNPLLLDVYLHYMLTIFFFILNNDNGKQINLEAKFLILHKKGADIFSPKYIHGNWRHSQHNEHIDKQKDTKHSLLLRINNGNPPFPSNIRTSSLFKIQFFFLLYNMQHIWHNLNMFCSEKCSH